jgi:hypothetical protein
MIYIMGKWYVLQFDGSLMPCQNYKTAKYLVENGYAASVVDVTRELLES